MGALAGAIWLVAVAASQGTAGVARDDSNNMSEFAVLGIAATA